jgi:8-oxo-dGTP pyrophosphatase MutT (NUDIX family)
MGSDKNPWTILSGKEIYDNPWISVTEYAVVNPAGSNGIYGKIFFKNLAIGIVPLDDEMNTWLVGQYRFTIDQYTWEVPAGGCPKGTDPLVTAKRELAEETGLVASNWTTLMEIHTSNSVTDEFGFIYLARGLEQHQPSPEETEELAIKKLPFEEAYKMVTDGTITDSISVAGILRIKLLIADGKL